MVLKTCSGSGNLECDRAATYLHSVKWGGAWLISRFGRDAPTNDY